MPSWIIIAVIVVVVLGALGYVASRKPQLPSLSDDELDKQDSGNAAKRLATKAAADRAKKKPSERPSAGAAKTSAREGDDDEDVSISDAPMVSAAPLPSDPSPPPPPASKKRRRDVAGLRKSLGKVRESGGFFGRLKELFTAKKELDPAIVEQLEEILLTSDVGVGTTERLLTSLKEQLEKDELKDSDAVFGALQAMATDMLDLPGGGALRNHGTPTVVMMVGVNGTGKTTTIGKIATQLTKEKKTVLLVAADTFRAAAVAQLKAWARRVGCNVFAGKDNADPSSVVFDAVKKGIEDGVDYILIDTAGRLHTKANLMDELKKMVRTCAKALDGTPHETLLVVDGTTGQNAVQQAQLFGEALDLTGIVLTKLDGTAKGGAVLAIAAEHELPVRYIGVGERPKDLRDFDAGEFVEAMLGQGDGSSEAAE